MTQPYAATSFQQPQVAYQQVTHARRAAIPPAYTIMAAECSQPTEVTEASEVQETVQDAGAYDAAYHRYIERLRATFQNMRNGNLVKAGPCLFELSKFLLGQAVELGTEFLASRFLTYY